METLREFLGLGVVEFTDFIIKSVFLLFTAIVVTAILIIRYKEVRHEKKQIKAIIDSVKKVEKVEGILRQYQKTGFKDLEQLAIDIVKICNRKIIFLTSILLFSGIISAQQYQDPFPDSRAPYRFRIYEKEVLDAKNISRIDTYWVVKKYNRVWMQGVYPFEGDTTKLKYVGREIEFMNGDTAVWLVSPAYKMYDTVYILPTLEEFEMWKEEKGYK